MKPVFEKVPLINSSFLIKKEKFISFDIRWHTHPEYEIALIEKGKGKMFVGNNVNDLNSRGLYMFAPNLPHAWSSDQKRGASVNQTIVQFSEDFVGQDWLLRNEFKPIALLFERSYGGIEFFGETKKKVAQMISRSLHKKGFDRMIDLLQILNALAVSNDFRILSQIKPVGKLNNKSTEKLNAVYRFVLDHFSEHLSLDRMAEFTDMTPPAFSRYFKKSTRKTFSAFLNEVRIEHACKLLVERKFTVTEICFRSGYNNLSNFNRQFKLITGASPSQFVAKT